MQPIPYTLTNDLITVIVDGQPLVVRSGGAQYAALREALFREEWEKALELTKSPKSALAEYIGKAGLGKFTVDGTTLKFGDQEVPADVTGRIDAMLTRGESPVPLLRFFERLQQNPSWRSVTQLFNFLQKANIPIEEDGTFLTYKGVNQDLTDKYTGTIDNSPGQVVRLPRNQISDDENELCHFGLHVCSPEYLGFFGGDRTVVCRVKPEDVVCIPKDHRSAKMRVCEYEVVGHYTGQLLPSTSVTKTDLVDDQYEDEEDADEESETDQVDEIEDEIEHINEPTPTKPVEAISLTFDEKALVTGGDIIGAIKAIRDRVPGTGLREAKDAVDEERELQRAWGVRPTTSVPSESAEEVQVHAEQSEKLRPARTPVTASDLKKLAKLPPRELLDETIDALRAYAAKLKIVGASKLPGGKVALVKQIAKARRR